ncbi:MAG: LytR/AlgR family response regulator transcription factor [Henriciella sp.]
MLKAVICDDEQPALNLLADMLSETNDIKLVAKCLTAEDALSVINSGGIDIAFFDVEMPQITGVDAAIQITVEPKPLIIFVTAHAEYAVDAFGVDAVDYVLKPLTKSRIEKAVEKAVRLTRLIEESQQGAAGTEQTQGGSDADEFVTIKDAASVYFLPLKEIVWIEAAGDYSLVHKTSGEIAIRRTLSSLVDELPDTRFRRIHRSSIVSMERISEIKRLAKGEAELFMDNGALVRASRSYRPVIKEIIARQS